MTATPTRIQEPEAAGRAPRRRSRRDWRRRVLLAANVFVALCIVVTAAGYGYFRLQFGRIPTIEGLGASLRNQGEGDPDMPMHVLLVGSDTRATLSPEEAESFGTTKDAGGQRSDAIIILRADPKAEKAAMLSIPRDLWVPLAGTKRSDRINSAFADGPAQLIATIRDALGIEIDHYVEVDFNGFRGIVQAVGGVPMYVAAPARDSVTGLHIPQAGCVTLDGEQALAYVRSRKYEYFEGGRWHMDPTGDLGRINRQQDFIRRAMKKSIQRGARNPATLNALINTGVHNVKIDDTFSPTDILRLGRRFRSLEPDAVETLPLPTVGARVDGKSVLKLKQPEAQDVIDRFKGKLDEQQAPAGGAPAIAPATIRVRVLNGSGVSGQATEVSAALRRAGYNVTGTGDADSHRYTRPVIRFGTGQRDKALVLQSQVAGGAELRADPSIRGIDLVLVTGSRFTGMTGAEADPASPPAAAGQPAPPSTTAAPARPGTTEKAPEPQTQC